MRLCKTAGIAVAAVFTIAPSAFAQTPAPNTQTTRSAATPTFTGCLMKETDYRRAHNLGGGAAGGVGLGDEFVLTDVSVTPARPAATTDRSAAGAAASASASATTCADKGLAYRVTGTAEEKIKGLVGHQLEIQGRFKDAAAAGAAPRQGEVPAEVEIVSFREAPRTEAVNEPAAPVAATPEPPPPTRSTVETPRAQPATPAAAPASEPRELPHTASATPLVLLIGAFALAASLALTMLRRRVA